MAYNDIFFQIRKLEFLFRIFQRRAGMSEPMLFCAYGFVSPCFIQIIILPSECELEYTLSSKFWKSFLGDSV